jgi:hypothetical protein
MWKARLAVVIVALGIDGALAEPVATAQKRLDDWRAYHAALPWLHQQFNKSQLDEIEQSNIRMLEAAKAAVEEEKRQRAAAAKAKAARKPQEDALRERERKFFECIWHPDRLIGLTRDQLREKCGYWDKVNRTTTASGVREQIVYSMVSGPRFYVYTENGIVTAVQN